MSYQSLFPGYLDQTITGTMSAALTQAGSILAGTLTAAAPPSSDESRDADNVFILGLLTRGF